MFDHFLTNQDTCGLDDQARGRLAGHHASYLDDCHTGS
jgi:hypothetical protein